MNHGRFDPIRPAYFTVPGREARRGRPDADRGLWAHVDVQLELLSPLHVGAAGAALGSDGSLFQAQARRSTGQQRQPIIPGSSFKGALRAVVEAMTASCDPFDRDTSCSRFNRGAAQGQRVEICPACQAFGCMVWRGRINVSELLPRTSVQTELMEIGQRFSHGSAPRRGRRLYGVTPEQPEPRARETIEVMPQGTTLFGALRCQGVPAWILGVVTMALGIGPHALPMLRVGGGKNRGLGQCKVELTSLRWAEDRDRWVRGERHLAQGEAAVAVVASWQQSAFDHDPGLKDSRHHIERGYR